MAEALSLIGSLSAIMQLTGYLVKSTRELVACVETLRSAPKEIEYFILETSIFTDQLRYFHDLAKDSTEKLDEKFKAKRASLVRKIVRQCRLVRRGFSRLVRRFIEVNGTGTAPFNALRARILWLWKKPDLPELRLSLQSATANVMLLCNLFSYEELIRKNANDERLEMLQEQLQNWVSTVKKLRHELADYQRRKQSTSESESMADISHSTIEDTRELERYVAKAIRSYSQEAAVPRTGRRSSPPGPPPPPRAPEPTVRVARRRVPRETRRGSEEEVRESATRHLIPDNIIESVESESSESNGRSRERLSNEVLDSEHGSYTEEQPVDANDLDVTEIANVGSLPRTRSQIEEGMIIETVPEEEMASKEIVLEIGPKEAGSEVGIIEEMDPKERISEGMGSEEMEEMAEKEETILEEVVSKVVSEEEIVLEEIAPEEMVSEEEMILEEGTASEEERASEDMTLEEMVPKEIVFDESSRSYSVAEYEERGDSLSSNSKLGNTKNGYASSIEER